MLNSCNSVIYVTKEKEMDGFETMAELKKVYAGDIKPCHQCYQRVQFSGRIHRLFTNGLW
jgi:hypothetical protein